MEQRGDYDLNAGMIDWTDARRQKTSKSRRLARAVLGLLPR
jgi:hypothetical protein